MKAGAVAVGALALLAVGGVAYAATKEDEHPPLPPPSGPNDCLTTEDVNDWTTRVLEDDKLTAQELRDDAANLRALPPNDFCDEAAYQAAQASATLLEGKANTMGGIIPSIPSGGLPPIPNGFPPVFNVPPGGFGSVWFPPPGYVGSQHLPVGLHGEPGTVFWYADGSEWFQPDDRSLSPYYIPGGSWELPHTQGDVSTGACCSACARGEQCEGCE